MSVESSNARVPEDPHGVTEPLPHHHVNYLAIFSILVVLTIITVGVALLDIHNETVKVLLALFIASVKGICVAMFFMHLKFEGKLIYLIFIVPLLLCVLIVTALIPDVLMTSPTSSSASMHLFNPPPMSPR